MVVELAILISYPTSERGIIVLSNRPQKYTSIIKMKNLMIKNHAYAYLVRKTWCNNSYTRMAKQMKTLKSVVLSNDPVSNKISFHLVIMASTGHLDQVKQNTE